jgi:hypothetical protein
VLPAYADDNLLRWKINYIKSSIKAAADATKKDGLKVKAEKTEHMLTPPHKNGDQNHKEER